VRKIRKINTEEQILERSLINHQQRIETIVREILELDVQTSKLVVILRTFIRWMSKKKIIGK
jgi:hypothetical protein